MFAKLKKMDLTQKVLLAMFLGIIFGLFINITGLNEKGTFINEYIILGLFLIIGKMFVTALKMLVVPLVFFSIISGVCGIGNLKTLGRVGIKSFLLYMLTTAIAIAVAIGIALLINPGEGANLVSEKTFDAKEAPSLTQVIINLVPDNIISAMADGNMLQIIFFAILVGISVLMLKNDKTPLVNGVNLLNKVMMNMVLLVMSFAPYAVFALLAKAIAELGLDLILDLASYVFVLIAALAVHLFVTLMSIFKIFTKGLSIPMFMKKIREAQIYAFSTSSSNATIPVTLQTVTNKMGVKNSVSSFSIPFGATINMDGTAIMQGVATVFIANVYGAELGIAGYLTVILMSILASIGTAGVPGVGLVMLSMVFTQVGLPVEGIALILGVDRIIDMIRTAVNVSGDAVVSVIVSKSENEFDNSIFNDAHAGLKKESIKEDLKNSSHLDERM